MTDVARVHRATARKTVAAAVPNDRSTTGARIDVGLLTGSHDRSYALGLTLSLVGEGVGVDFVGSDELDAPELHVNPLIRFLNLRGDQTESVGAFEKAMRLSRYYVRLLLYAAAARPRIFHILWNNKVEFLDRTLLMLYYRLCGRRIVFTAHNVNAAARDGRDSRLNRLTLGVQYRLSHHIFVHTEKMKSELRTNFSVPEEKVSVIPFGINNTAPNTALTSLEARRRLGLRPSNRVALFFGQIAPYKGLEYLVAAASELLAEDPELVLLIAGKVKKGAEQYWRQVQGQLPATKDRVITHIEHIPDADIEIYFKAADVLVLPYTKIFQSGVPFLAYSFGLPVVATDVGSLRDDVIEGETGFVCRPSDPAAVGEAVKSYFASELHKNLHERRAKIARLANERYSWGRVAEITAAAYRRVLLDH